MSVTLPDCVRSQNHRMLQALELGPVDCIFARDEMNIFQPNTRITDLRRQGYVIECQMQLRTDARGNTRKVGVWFLISKPVPQQQSLSL